MITATKVIDQIDDIQKSDSFHTEQLVNSALFGSNSGLMATFNENIVYRKGQKVPFLTSNGEVLILVCNNDGTTGPFNATDWDEWNVVDEVEAMYTEFAILSWHQPSLRRNKIWLQVKNESLEDAREIGLGNDTGLLIYRNLIVSANRPTMTEDIIWGQIKK